MLFLAEKPTCGVRNEQGNGPEKVRKEETREIAEGKTRSEERQESRQISRLFFGPIAAAADR
jgi:hypothetical protein